MSAPEESSPDDGEAEPDDRTAKKLERAHAFHEQTGEFDDVAKALVALLAIGIVLYVIFLL